MQVSTINLDQFASMIDSMTNSETHHTGSETVHTGTHEGETVIIFQNGPSDTATLIKLA
ncbi:MAG: hypothetical protein IBX55_21760 [Methyloprofundus sp.]|nr:hypothetical protein [Methyloprofundus sp.]